MKFVTVGQPAIGAEALFDRLVAELKKGMHVLWLVPGGSNIPLSAHVMSRIPETLTAHMTIMLTDERFGHVGHADSNARQLEEHGFDPKQARFNHVLQKDLDMHETCRLYATGFQTAIKAADVAIGQFGMGADGHIAGILPGSRAVTSADLAAVYEAPNFTRMTLTPRALQQLTAAYVYAFGPEKKEALTHLRDEKLELNLQPAQILRQIPEAYVYNDQIGDEQ